jgi:hypothetical protein
MQESHFLGDHFTRRVLVDESKRNDGESWINSLLGRVWVAKFTDVHRCAWRKRVRSFEHVMRVNKSRQVSFYGFN